MKRLSLKRGEYKEAQTFLGQLEVCVRSSKEIFRLQEGPAIVWTMIDGKRSAEDVIIALSKLMSRAEVQASLKILFELKLIKE